MNLLLPTFMSRPPQLIFKQDLSGMCTVLFFHPILLEYWKMPSEGAKRFTFLNKGTYGTEHQHILKIKVEDIPRTLKKFSSVRSIVNYLNNL